MAKCASVHCTGCAYSSYCGAVHGGWCFSWHIFCCSHGCLLWKGLGPSLWATSICLFLALNLGVSCAIHPQYVLEIKAIVYGWLCQLPLGMEQCDDFDLQSSRWLRSRPGTCLPLPNSCNSCICPRDIVDYSLLCYGLTVALVPKHLQFCN